MVWECLKVGGCMMHEINISEFCFSMTRKHPQKFNVHLARKWIYGVGVYPVDGFPGEWADRIAEIRLAEKSLNIGDGVAIMLASALGVPVLTAEGNFMGAAECAGIELIRRRPGGHA